MPSRRHHKKSRLGCAECKSRRVKCDEERPVCGGCLKSGAECRYPKLPRQRAPASLASLPEPSGSSTCQETPPVLSISPDPSQPAAFDHVDLMLMHYYSVETSRQLFYGDRQHQVWQRDIPALASSNEVLIHGILALAALHKARTEPAQRTLYRTRTLHHHAIGLQMFKKMVAAADVANAEVLISFTLLLGVWVYGFPETEGECSRLDDILDILEYVRGSKAIFLLYRDIIAHTPIGIFVISPLEVVRSQNPDDKTPAHHLLDAAGIHGCLPSDRAAIHILNTLLERFLSGKDHSRSATGWAAVVGEDFWKRLRAHEPVAIFIFAHNAILLRCSENGYWWLTGWAERILQACDAALSAEDKVRFDWAVTMDRIRTVGEDMSHWDVPDAPDLGWS